MARLAAILALAATVGVAPACRGPTAGPSRRAGSTPPIARDAGPSSGDATGAAALPVQGPPEAFGDGALPPSIAAGPEADATRAVLAALRASIGFWRTEHNARDRCPTFDDLRGTPGAAFDPTNMRRDVWGTEFEIQCVGPRVRLRSAGPDRQRDTPDDIWAQ